MTVEEFYQLCKKRNVEKFRLECYGITRFGDISYRTEVTDQSINIDSKEKNIILCAYDD